MRGSPSLPIRTSISRLHRDCQPNRTISLYAPPVNLSGPPVLIPGAAMEPTRSFPARYQELKSKSGCSPT